MKKTILEQVKKIGLKFFLLAASLFLAQTNLTAKATCNLAASFSYTVGANGVVNFASTSTGTTASANYQWYFYPGGGVGATVTHTFASNGVYPVALYVYDSPCFDSTVVYVTVNTSTCNLNANFTYTVGSNGLVNFTSTSTGTNVNTSFLWYFNPGSATGASASHSFPNSGVYPVSLVTSENNCYDSIVIYITVPTGSCNLNAGFNYTVGAGGVVNFESTSTGTTSTTSYQWYFGPGFATGANVTHTYNNNGTYGVSLFASDSSCQDSLTIYITVTTATCNLSAGYTYTLGANGTVTLASTSTGTTSSSVFQWYFYPGSASGATTTHTFSSNGNYPVTLLVNNGNCTDSVTGYIPINTTTCNINASFSYTVLPNGVVQFSNTSTGTTPTTVYFWDFGDIQSAYGQNVTHTYSPIGLYTINFHVYDSLFACNDSMVISIYVGQVTCNVHANFSYTVNSNGIVNFASTSTGTTSAATYSWYFPPANTATGSTATNYYANNGIYPVYLTVFDTLCSDTVLLYINVTGLPCSLNANFTYTVSPNGVVHFVSTSTGTTPATTYWWDFGDSHTGTGSSVTHTYSPLAQYYVILHVNDSLCNDSVYIVVTTSAITGIKNNNTPVASIKIYPNPNNGEFILSSADIETNTGQLAIEIYNTLGQVVFKTDETVINGELNKTINLQAFDNGIYFLRTDNGKITKTTRLIIQK